MAKLLNCVFKITSNVINLDESGKPDGDIENDEFSVSGTLKTESGVTTIKYKEERDGAKILCEISADGDEVKVARRGDVVCDMIFSLEKTHKSLYRIPPFSFDMEISTSRIENTIEKSGGTLSLFYSMNVGGAKKRCRMKIERKD
jgi:uncharacterized beta-barrel protein YwiB (DUF1934 family)